MTDTPRPGALPAAAVAVAVAVATPADTSAAGAMLRAARQQQGLHIAALAAAMKVPPARLEALEAGRYQDLVDTTFARALAQAMCRALRIDPVPVLALLPGSSPDALGRVDGGLNTPFRERGGRGLPADLAPWRHPVLWLVALLLLAAAAFVLVPAGALRDPVVPAAAPSAAPGGPVMPPDGAASGALGLVVTPAADAPASSAELGGNTLATMDGAKLAAPTPSTPSTLSTPGKPLAPAADAAVPASGGEPALVSVRALKDTWIQAVDANNQTLLARLVQAGETVALSPAMPLKVRIGNVAGTELLLRGKPVDLSGGKRDNIVSLTLQ